MAKQLTLWPRQWEWMEAMTGRQEVAGRVVVDINPECPRCNGTGAFLLVHEGNDGQPYVAAHGCGRCVDNNGMAAPGIWINDVTGVPLFFMDHFEDPAEWDPDIIFHVTRPRWDGSWPEWAKAIPGVVIRSEDVFQHQWKIQNRIRK